LGTIGELVSITISRATVGAIVGAGRFGILVAARAGLAAAGAATLVGRVPPGELDEVERDVVYEAETILASPEFETIQQAFASGARGVVVRIGNFYVQYEPELADRFVAVTDLQGGGFALGPQAFTSNVELAKTVLWEVYRLVTIGPLSGATQNFST